MDEKIKSQDNSGLDQNSCNCEGDCCPPKKKSIWPKIIFTVVILAALGIIAAKLLFTSPPAPASTVTNSQVVNDPNSPKWADSCKSGSGCDTIKGSSCCGK